MRTRVLKLKFKGVNGCGPENLLKMNFFTRISQGFWPLVRIFNRKRIRNFSVTFFIAWMVFWHFIVWTIFWHFNIFVFEVIFFLSININIFLSITLSVLQAAGSSTKGCRAWSLLLCTHLPCTHLGRAYKKQRCFEQNSEFALVYEIQPLQVGFFAFFNASFSKDSGAEWVNPIHFSDTGVVAFRAWTKS